MKKEQDGRAKVTGYEVGGKSGTSEPTETNKDEGYTASFIAISPIENTRVVCLVMLFNLTEEQEHQGGTVCGPVARTNIIRSFAIYGYNR